MASNKQVRLAKRPSGMTDASTWDHTTKDIPSPGEGEFLCKIEYISLDPAMRGWLNDAKSYIPPVEIGAVMRAGTVGTVIESKHPDYKEGDFVVGSLGVQEYAVSDGSFCYKSDTFGLPKEKFLGVLGMPGFTAYFGLLDVTNPQPGETLVVSGAAGAVGSVVGQIGKLKGCKVVGIAGGPEKCKMVVEDYGFDACIDYKAGDIRGGLKEHCPKGIDIYFDNVGGEILDLCLARIRYKGRVSICGAISQYNSTEPVKGPANYLALLVNGAKMEGFVVLHFKDRYMEAAKQLGEWMMAGKIKSKETVVEGIDTFPDTFNRLFSGNKTGKLVLKP